MCDFFLCVWELKFEEVVVLVVFGDFEYKDGDFVCVRFWY